MKRDLMQLPPDLPIPADDGARFQRWTNNKSLLSCVSTPLKCRKRFKLDTRRSIVKIQDVPFMTTDWSKISPTIHPGDSGEAHWRTLEVGNVRVRMLEYTPGYVADHWCSRGHVLLVLEGELVTELKDGRRFVLKPGTSYQVATDAEHHRSSTKIGAKLFIVD